jgi:hypothetical protein
MIEVLVLPTNPDLPMTTTFSNSPELEGFQIEYRSTGA